VRGATTPVQAREFIQDELAAGLTLGIGRLIGVAIR
jgi:hypothetical protein